MPRFGGGGGGGGPVHNHFSPNIFRRTMSDSGGNGVGWWAQRPSADAEAERGGEGGGELAATPSGTPPSSRAVFTIHPTLARMQVEGAEVEGGRCPVRR